VLLTNGGGEGRMRWGRTEILSFIQSSALWAVGLLAGSVGVSVFGGATASRSLVLGIAAVGLVSWLAAAVSAEALAGSLASRPYLVRLASAALGSFMLQSAFVLIKFALGDLPSLSPSELLQVLALGDVFLGGPLTTDAVVRVAAVLSIPAIVIALVDWRYKSKRNRMATLVVGDGDAVAGDSHVGHGRGPGGAT
jgi:hypothetical protein